MPRFNRWTTGIIACLVLLVVWSGTLTWLSFGFAGYSAIPESPILLFIALQIGAGLLYLLTLLLIKRHQALPVLTAAIIAAGLLMRLLQLPAAPILETDFYRYLWDGAVVAQGYNPYTYSPDQIIESSPDLPDEIAALAERSGDVIGKVNHSHLRTIYPATAQAAFTLAYWIDPFKLNGLRMVWLMLDVLAVSLLMMICRGRPDSRFVLAIYWLNPMLIKEVFNTAHMELTLIVPLLAAMLLVQRGLHRSSGVALGFAAGAKVWPVLWLPLVLRHTPGLWKRVGVAVGFIVPVGLFSVPILLASLDATSGFTAYAQRWQMNDSAYMVLHELAKLISPANANPIARIAVMVILAGLLVYRLLRSPPSFEWLVTGAAVLTTALFLLSPTQFPWYYLWLMPILALKPMWSTLALTVTLPLYYLRFYLDAFGYAAWHDYGVVWIEFAPIWILLAWELWRHRQRRIRSIQNSEATCIATNS